MKYDEHKPDRDKAKGSGGWDLYKLERMLSDIELQPEWRTLADRAARFYDGKQLSDERLAQLEQSGEPPTVVNLMSGAINGALGQEARTRLDWVSKADSDPYQDVADVISLKLKEAKRETGADQAISDGYKGQIVPGIGWVEVSRNPDVLGYPYRVTSVHRNEVWWDWRARRMDKQDGKWICRQCWVDLDEANEMMPQHREVFEEGCNNGPITDSMARTLLSGPDTFDSMSETRRSFNRFEEEWLDNSARRRVRLYWIWYKQSVQVVSLVCGTRRFKFNPQNILHQELVRRGIGYLIKGASNIIRQAIFAGPFRLSDEATTWRNYPIVPFVGFEDDEYGTPYGLALGMMDPQEEYNERRSRLRWLLTAAQAFVDSDALDPRYGNIRQFAQELMKPDALFVLNPKRTNRDGPRVEHNQSLKKEQFEAMQDSKQLIQEQPRIYSAMLGDAPTGVTSGLAINSLVEQGMVALGETNDNYRGGRAAVGDRLVDLIIEDMSAPNMPVLLGSGKSARIVVLNTFDENGLPKNHVQDAAVTLGLGDVPATPAYKMQQQVNLQGMMQASGGNPTALAILFPMWLETTDLPNRDIYASWARKQFGVPEPGEKVDPAAEVKQQQEMQAKKDAMEQSQIRKIAAEADEKEASAALKATQAEKTAAERLKVLAETEQIENAANEDQLLDDAMNEARGRSKATGEAA